MTNSSLLKPWPSRNSWWILIKNGGSFHNYGTVYQRVYLWNIYGISMGNIYGVSMEYYGISMVYLWNIYGISMEYLWNICGISIWNIYMEYLWNIYGISMGYGIFLEYLLLKSPSVGGIPTFAPWRWRVTMSSRVAALTLTVLGRSMATTPMAATKFGAKPPI